MAEEISELHERAEHGASNSKLASVTITMAVLAVLVAAVSLMSHRIQTEELLSQTKATDQWAFFQAKNIREHSYELFLDELGVLSVGSAARADEVKAKYTKEIKRYQDELKEIQAQANEAEAEVTLAHRRGNRFDLGEVLLEASLVICSITLLTRQRIFWVLGSFVGLAGVVIAATGFLVH